MLLEGEPTDCKSEPVEPHTLDWSIVSGHVVQFEFLYAVALQRAYRFGVDGTEGVHNSEGMLPKSGQSHGT